MSAWVPRLVLGVGALALIAAVVSLAVGEGGPQPRDVGGVNDVQRLFGGIEQEGAHLGSDDAEVTVTVFNDLQCTTCAEFELDVVDPLVEEYVRPGDARLEFRHFSIAPNDTTSAAIAAEAAGDQARQWQYLDTFFRNQGLVTAEVTDELLREIAEAVPELEPEIWDEDYSSAEAKAAVREDAMLADQLRLPAEPAAVVSGPGGQRQLIETPTLTQIEAAIAAVR